MVVAVSLSNCEPSGALHLHVFEQPDEKVFKNNLFGL